MLALPDRLVNKVLLPLRRKLEGDVYGSPERMRAHVERLSRRPISPDPPRAAMRGIRLTQRSHEGWPVYEAEPEDRPAATSILYLHGGAYVREITRWHWLLVRQFVREVPARCTVPIYPLAPSATAEEVVPVAGRLVTELVAKVGAERTVLAGDSAGGGMAVAASLWLREKGLPQPERLVLLSPFMDATVSDPRQDSLDERDAMLSRPGLAEAARMYAGSLEVEDPRVSPINGDLRGLPAMTILTGADDILDPDSQRLAKLARDAGVPVDLHSVDAAPHVFPAFPTRQGARGRALIVEACRQAA